MMKAGCLARPARSATFCGSPPGRSARRAGVRYITKTTYLLLDHLQSIGNFGQHREEFPETKVTIGFAASVVHSSIALVECLTSDLSRTVDSA